jgi:hypothetical protein
VIALFQLIDWFLDLPDEVQEHFQEDVIDYEKEKGMPYLSRFERIGFDKGFKKGREEGLEKGQEIGLRKGLLEGIALDLGKKFGQRGRRLVARARAIDDLAELRELARVIKEAETEDDVRRHLS